MSKKKELGLKARLREANGEERGAILDGLPYEVGFGKPPQKTRFATGNQAGKKGRPKGSENLVTIIREEFDAKVEVTEGGKPRKLSKRRVAVRQVANKAASGDIKSFAIYLELLARLVNWCSRRPARRWCSTPATWRLLNASRRS